MADILIEHFFFRIEIVANEIEKVVRFAQRFPIGHVVWRRFKDHPIRPLLKYLDFSRLWSSVKYDNSDQISSGDCHGEVPTLNEREAAGKRQNAESEETSPPAPLKRVCIYEVDLEPVFEDALESQVSI